MRNKKAWFDYFISEEFTAGMILVGSEVKALRDNKAGFNGSYIYVKGDELYVRGLYIGDFKQADQPHDNTRERKLLLNRHEINKCSDWLKIKGNTIVPLELFTMNNVFKLKIGFATGKNHGDKRETIKQRDIERETQLKLK